MEKQKETRFNEIKNWLDKNNAICQNMYDEALDQTKSFIKEFGEETEETYTFKFDEENEPCITNVDSELAENYYIQKIVLYKNQFGIRLYYSDFNYDYIHYTTLCLDERMSVLDNMVEQIMD